jgi:hypothetical protein
MDFALLPEDKKAELAKLMLTPLNSALEIKDWVKFYLDLEIPTENTDPDSTSNPLHAAWYIYETFKYNKGNERPGAIMISARECMKTIMVTILELLLMLHLQLEVGHAAAIETQSSIALGYVEGFLRKIGPLLDAAGWVSHSSNKRVIKYKTPEGKTPFIKILVCKPAGMNGLHVSALFLDELDLADKAALKEGRNIVGYSRGIYGMQIYVSSYKYSFGNVAEALEKADEMHYKILKWNLMDLAEKCPTERHLPDGPKQDMYVAKSLPLKNITVEEFNSLPEVEKTKFDLVVQAHSGCIKCPLLPLCKKRLSEKDDSATGGFYKPISSVIQKFRENDPDTAESQLLCRRPGSEGLVYPRFSTIGNSITAKDAYEMLLDAPTKYSTVSDATLLYTMQNMGIEFYAGVDWGHNHPFVILIVAKMPNGEWLLVDTYSCSNLEWDDMLDTAKAFRDKYNPQKWFCDTNRPEFIKSFNKNGMRCADFKKDVLAGIVSVRSKIVNSNGKRNLKIISNEVNKKTILAIAKHRFLLDSQGNVTSNPADEMDIADICDALRYIGQNLWSVKGTYRPSVEYTDDPGKVGLGKVPTHNANEQMRNEIMKRVQGSSVMISTTKKKGGFTFNM